MTTGGEIVEYYKKNYLKSLTRRDMTLRLVGACPNCRNASHRISRNSDDCPYRDLQHRISRCSGYSASESGLMRLPRPEKSFVLPVATLMPSRKAMAAI